MKFFLIFVLVPLSIILQAQPIMVAKNSPMLYLLVGTYTNGNSKGIDVYRFNMETGKADYLNETTVSNPSYFVVSKDKNFVYAVSENEGKKAMVYTFFFDNEAGKLSLINSQPTQGNAPCYINIDNQSGFVATANYSGGSVSIFPISENGTLQHVSQVFYFNSVGHHSKKSHLHSVVFSPDRDYLFATDLGKDQIYRFSLNNTNSFLTIDTAATVKLENGSGPRHLTFHPNQKFAYVINELSGKITVFKYKNHILQPTQYIISDTSTISGNKGSGDIGISPDGKFLYTSNRESINNIAIFKINGRNGKLSLVGFQPTGLHPRNFIITPNGNYLLVANMKSNTIQIFKMNKTTGLLTENTSNLITKSDRPVCLKFIEMK